MVYGCTRCYRARRFRILQSRCQSCRKLLIICQYLAEALSLALQASEIDVLMGSLAVGLCAGGGFCAGDKNTIAHQRINSAAYVFSASLPPLLAVAAHEGIAYLTGAMSTNGQLPLSGLNDNIKTLRTALDKVDNYIYVPSANISPLVHIHIRNSNGLSFYDQEHILQEIVDECMNNGVLISRTKKVWKQEAVEGSPSLRILVSAALPRKEMEKATNVLKVGFFRTLSCSVC